MNKRITQAEFDAVRPLLRMSPDRLESARLRLVEGLTLSDAGKCRTGEPYTRQSVDDAVKIVLRALHTYEELQEKSKTVSEAVPAGWERVTLVAPADLADEFRQRAAQAVAELPARKRTRRAPAVSPAPAKPKRLKPALEKSSPRGVKA